MINLELQKKLEEEIMRARFSHDTKLLSRLQEYLREIEYLEAVIVEMSCSPDARKAAYRYAEKKPGRLRKLRMLKLTTLNDFAAES